MKNSLRTRLSLTLTMTAGCMALILSGLWLRDARDSIHEEIDAANRVASQWMAVIAREQRIAPDGWRAQRLLSHLQEAGRLRANKVEVYSPEANLLYQSPPSLYKAGREAPAWFSNLVSPRLAIREFRIGQLKVVLTPDASRAVLDIWDDLASVGFIISSLLLLVFLLSWWMLSRALRPLDEIVAALQNTGEGNFNIRLPVYPVQEMGRLAQTFNNMSECLRAAVHDNIQLESERDRAQASRSELENERKAIARDIHDELAQEVAAISLLAASLHNNPATGNADVKTEQRVQRLIAATSHLRETVYGLLHKLRTPDKVEGDDLGVSLNRWLSIWQQQHPEISLSKHLRINEQSISDDIALALLRIMQESLTNVLRHAQARKVEINLRMCQEPESPTLELSIVDDGRGLPAADVSPGFGHLGIAERAAALGGKSWIQNASAGGVQIRVRLPLQRPASPTRPATADSPAVKPAQGL